MSNIQAFSTVNSKVNFYAQEYSLDKSQAFIAFVLDYFNENLNQDDILDCITDWSMDCGIDAVYIEENEDKKTTIKIYNSKYTEMSKKALNNDFPSSETDKIFRARNNLYTKGELDDFNNNQLLLSKMQEIYEILEDSEKDVQVEIFFVSNMKNMKDNELQKIKRDMELDGGRIRIYTLCLDDLHKKILSKQRKITNANLKLSKEKFFQKTWWSVKSVIASISISDIIKLVAKNSDLNDNPAKHPDDEHLKNFLVDNNVDINDMIFEENVRLYKWDTTKINENIKETAKNKKETKNFFYFNNWITIVCKDYKLDPSYNSPTLEMEDFQIVNWQQTIKTLYKVFVDSYIPDMRDIEVLVRIYATNNQDLRYYISEYTNSQNAVSDKDLRSNDDTQKSLEKDLETKWYYYERKPWQYKLDKKEKNKIITSEKAWQLIMTFYLDQPSEAKNKKSLIFWGKYEDIFDVNKITADYVLLPYKIYSFIEEKRRNREKEIKTFPQDKQKVEIFITFASLYCLYTLSKLIHDWKDHNDYIQKYDDAIAIIKNIVENEMNTELKYGHANFFKNKKLKSLIDKKIENLKSK